MTEARRRDERVLIYGGFLFSLAIMLVMCRPWDLYGNFAIGAPIGRDFVNFWLGGRLAIEGRLDLLTDFSAYGDLVAQRFGHDPADRLVFSYPPSILPFLVPFGALPYGAALALWTLANGALLVAAARLITHDRRLVTAACLSPAAMMMVLYGHFGGAVAWLAIYAVTRADKRPALAGLCLGALSVKPQLAAMLGLVLLLSGRWRAALWSLPPAAAIVLGSILAFGLAPWTGFVAETLPFHARMVADFVPEMLRTVTSVYAAGRLAGLPGVVAQGLQFGFSAALVVGTVYVVRRDGINPRSLTLILFATLGALPYVQHYDLAIVAPALAVALFGASAGRPFLDLAPAALVWLAPAVTMAFGIVLVPVAPILVALAMALALGRTVLADRPSPAAVPS